MQRGESRIQLFHCPCSLIPLFPQLLDNTTQVSHSILLDGDSIRLLGELTWRRRLQ